MTNGGLTTRDIVAGGTKVGAAAVGVGAGVSACNTLFTNLKIGELLQNHPTSFATTVLFFVASVGLFATYMTLPAARTSERRWPMLALITALFLATIVGYGFQLADERDTVVATLASPPKAPGPVSVRVRFNPTMTKLDEYTSQDSQMQAFNASRLSVDVRDDATGKPIGLDDGEYHTITEVRPNGALEVEIPTLQTYVMLKSQAAAAKKSCGDTGCAATKAKL